MTLIQQLVLKDDEGRVILPSLINNSSNSTRGGMNDENNPANNNVNSSNNNAHGFFTNNDPSLKKNLNNDDIILDDDEYFMKKHKLLLDGTSLDVADIFNDVTSLFTHPGGGGSGYNNNNNVERNLFESNSSSNSGHGTSINFSMESLSTLLDRIDESFLNNNNATSTTTINQSRRGERTPPSKALFQRLCTASQSVDHLMNLLDEWHALLEGIHIGYPPPPPSNSNNIHPPPSRENTISIDGESTFGIYMRKLCLGMEEIPFEALSRLWNSLKEFVKREQKMSDEMEEKGEGKRYDGEEEKEYVDCYDEEYYYGSMVAAEDWLPSSPQIERIVRNTCLRNNLDSLLMHHHGNKNNNENFHQTNSSGGSSSSAKNQHGRQQQLHNLLETHPECPSIHFLLYLTSLANGRHSQAIESLHRYFDYAMIHERKERAERSLMIQVSGGGGGDSNGSSMLTTGGGAGVGTMGNMGSGMGGITGGMTGGIVNGTVTTGVGQQQHQQQRGGAAGGATNNVQPMYKESNVMQYAAILLAQTYYRFGYTMLSLQATEEAIRVAQQSGDAECVCFANGWLALVSSSLGSNNNNGVVGRRSRGGGRGCSGSVYASVGGLDCSGSSLGNAIDNNYYRPLAPASSNSNSIGNHLLTNRREEEAMLHRCQARAAERGLTSLASGASLELARRLAYQRHGMSSGVADDSTNVEGGGREGVSSLAWDSIQSAGRMPIVSQAGHVRGGNHRGTSAGGASSSATGQAPTDIYNMTPAEATSILGRQNVAIAGLWESTGHLSLASLSSCATLYGSGGSDYNEGGGGGNAISSMAMNRVLSSFANGPGLDVWSRMDHHGEDTGDVTNQQCRGGTYAAILNHLATLSQGSNSERALIAASTLHEWSMRSYDLSLAQGLNTLLANHASLPSSPALGGALPAVEASLVYLAQSTHLICQRGEYDKAKAFCRRACWLANRHGLMYHLGWNLLQLSLINLEASSSRAPERALAPLLECLDLAEKHAMDPLRAVALSTLSKIFLCMGGKRYGKARALLKSAMPLIMQHGHVWFQGEAFLTLAKCYLAEVSTKEKKNESTSTILKLHKTALAELKKSAFYFEQIEDVHRLRQVYYLQARVCQMLPDAKKERDQAAKVFTQLTVTMNKRVGAPIIANQQQNKQTRQWNVLRGVLITDTRELQQCVSMKQSR